MEIFTFENFFFIGGGIAAIITALCLLSDYRNGYIGSKNNH